MLVGVPREIKPDEYRVGMVPDAVRELVSRGHRVLIEAGAGLGAGFADDEYTASGAEISSNAHDIYGAADLIVKVKEPQISERRQLKRGQMIFTYLHLAPDPEQTRDLMASGVTAIAYETVRDAHGVLPLLAPMSKVAGRMAPQVAAHFLERPHGGRGVLLGSVDGSPPARIAILGAGTVGCSAATVASGMGANVTLVAHSSTSLRRARDLFNESVRVAQLDLVDTRELCIASDVVIGAALVVGGTAPKLVSAATVAAMKPGTVLVDVSIDQGGCFETSRPTTHSNPVYSVSSVVHYCVANMPGAVPRTSTFALSHATRPFILDIADKGFPGAFLADERLLGGLNVHAGRICCATAAQAQGLHYTPATEILGRAWLET
jgi:alanine dehydrogenase